MSADLDRLLGDTAQQPTSRVDTDALWARGRRRRRARHAVTAGAAALVLVIGGAGITTVLDGVGPAGIAPAGPAPTTPDPEVEASEGEAASEHGPVTGPEGELVEPAPSGLPTDEAPSDEDSALADASPLPDPARAADPCAGSEDRTGEGFIDVVSPVTGMHVGEQTKFIGCANVYEATVNWRIVDADGTTLRDGFVTATCGTGCVGEFSELVDLDGLPDGAVLQVFAIDAADGSDRHLVEIPVVSD